MKDSIQKINNTIVTPSTIAPETTQLASHKPKKPTNISFETSGYDKTNNTVGPSGNGSISIPPLSLLDSEQQKQLQAFYEKLPASQQNKLHEADEQLASALLTGGGGIVSTTGGDSSNTAGGVVTDGAPGGVQASYLQSLQAYANASGTSVDNPQTAMGALYGGIQASQETLTNLATTIQGNTDSMNTLNADQAEIQDQLANLPEGTKSLTITYHTVDANGQLVEQTETVTPTQAQSILSGITNDVSSIQSVSNENEIQLQAQMSNVQNGYEAISSMLQVINSTEQQAIANIK